MNVLIVAYSFPPSEHVGGIRPACFCRYLPRHGIEPIVLTVEERFCEGYDTSFVPQQGCRVVRTGMLWTPLEYWESRRRHSNSAVQPENPKPQPSQPIKERSFLKENILALLDIPDRYWGWYLPALQAARRLLEEEKIDAVLSTGPPQTGHLIACQLRKKYRVPWAADFRDPWVYPESGMTPGWRRAVDQWLEKRCIRTADLVLCNTERMREAFLERYPDIGQEKFRTLPNGFDTVKNRPSTPPRGNGLTRTIAHFGSIEGRRRIDGFCRAVSQLVRRGAVDGSRLKVVFIGSTDEANLAAAAREAPELLQSGCLEFRPKLPWEQAQEQMWKSDLLLIFQGPYRLQVPAKAYEYLQTGKPVFAVAEPGAVSDLLASTGTGLCASPDDPEEISARLLEALQLPQRSPEEARQHLPEYHYQALTERLAKWLHELSAANPREQAGSIHE